MNGLDAWTKLLVAVTGALGAIGLIAKQIVKRFPPRASSLAEDIKLLRTETESARKEAASARAEASTARDEVASVRRDMRLLTDYVHDVREDYARDTGRAPRDWPEGLRL